MGWWGSYDNRDTYTYAKDEKRKLEAQGFNVSIRSYGREIWFQKEAVPEAFGVILVRKSSDEIMTKDLDYTMGPYTSSKAPKKMVKRWAAAVSSNTLLEDIPKELSRYEGYPEVLELFKQRLEKGE